MEKEKTIKVLNSLITINNDRIAGYKKASKETDDIDLKTLFEQFISTSLKCRQQLVLEVDIMGGEASVGTMTSGKFFRMWMDIKAAIIGKDRKTILNYCEYGENMAKDIYDTVFENDSEHLSLEQFTMIYAQSSALNDDHNYLNALRTRLVEAPYENQIKSF